MAQTDVTNMHKLVEPGVLEDNHPRRPKERLKTAANPRGRRACNDR
jgi:hypothetical protein